MTKLSTSVALSTPSLTTAKLPATKPRTTLTKARVILPKIPMAEAILICFKRRSKTHSSNRATQSSFMFLIGECALKPFIYRIKNVLVRVFGFSSERELSSAKREEKKKEPGHQNRVLSFFALDPLRRGHLYYV